MGLTETIKRHALLTYFVVTFGLTWLCWFTLVFFLPGGFQPGGSNGASHPSLLIVLFPLGNVIPSLVGIILTRVVAGRSGLRDLFRQVVRWRVAPWCFPVGLFLTPVVTVGALVLAVALGSTAPALSIAVLVGGLGGALIAPLGEELGWRGFAFPRMQAQRSTLGASIVLGVLWGLWHVPRWIWGVMAAPAVLIPALGLQVLTITAFSVLIAWVYNNTGGSLLLTMLFHLSIVMTSYYPFPQQAVSATGWEQTLIYVGLLWAVVLMVVVVYGPRRLMRAPAPDRLQAAISSYQPRTEFLPVRDGS